VIRLFVVSPSPLVRAGLTGLLGGAAAAGSGERQVEVVGEAPGLDRLRPLEDHLLADEPWDLLLLDARRDLLDELAELAADRPALRAVVLGPVEGDEALAAAFAGRAWGYVPRESAAETLLAVVRAVAAGLTAVEPALAARWPLALPARAANPGADAGPEDLTAREREVLQLVAEGLPNKAIALRLGISEHTVKFHVAAILGKLGAASRAEAVRLGARRGLLVL